MATVFKDGVYITQYTSPLYLDWGLSMCIKLDASNVGYTVFESPHCLSGDSYGMKPPEGMDYEEAECMELLIPWDEDDWRESLEEQADDFIEAYLGTTPVDLLKLYHKKYPDLSNWTRFIDEYVLYEEHSPLDLCNALRGGDPRFFDLEWYLRSEGYDKRVYRDHTVYKRDFFEALDYIVVKPNTIYLGDHWMDKLPDPIMINLIEDIRKAYQDARHIHAAYLGKKQG